MENTSKGELMRLLYTEEELRNIDAAIPMDLWQTCNTRQCVMNFNDNGAFGKLEDMFDIAEEREMDVSEFVHLKIIDND